MELVPGLLHDADGDPVDPVHGVSPAVAATLAAREVLDDRIGVLAAQIHVLQAELVGVVSEFDGLEGWQGGGYRSLGQWLSVRTKFTAGESNRLARVALGLAEIPTLHGFATRGEISVGLMDSALRVSTPENEQAVAEVVRDCTPAQAAKVLSNYRNLAPAPEPDPFADPDLAPPAEPEVSCWWNTWHDELGRGRIDAALDEVTFALLDQAWAAASATNARDRALHPDSSTHADRCDANETATRLASTMLDAANDAGMRAPDGDRFLVQLHLDVESLARILGLELNSSLPVRLGSECFLPSTGQHLNDSDVARILCDAGIQVLVHARGVPLWLSNESKPFTRQQRRALRFRAGGKGGCEFPGCTHDQYLDAHHVLFVSNDGRTTLDNGVLLCGYHHRMLHRLKWTVTTTGDQSFTFWDGNTCLGTTSRRDRPGGRPPDLQRLPDIEGVPEPPDWIDPDTPKSTTRGEPMTSYALDVYLSKLLTA